MGLRRLRLGLAMLTYQDWLLFCFVLGVLGGTAAALAFGGPVVQGCILGAAGTAGAGNRYGAKDFLAVWRRNSQMPVQEIPVKHLKGKEVKAVCAYPESAECAYHWNKEAGTLTVELPARVSARIFELRY